MITPPPAGVNNSSYIGYMWPSSTKAKIQFKVPEFPYKQPLSHAEKINNCNTGAGTAMAIWAGLGQPNSPDIEQIGIYDCVTNGKVHWQGLAAFWPVSDQAVGGPIAVGDTLFAGVTRSGYTYTMTLRDAHKWTYTITRSYHHIEGDAEAIVEDTFYPGYPWTPLTEFQPVNILTSGNPKQEWNIGSWGYAVKDSNHEITVHG